MTWNAMQGLLNLWMYGTMVGRHPWCNHKAHSMVDVSHLDLFNKNLSMTFVHCNLVEYKLFDKNIELDLERGIFKRGLGI